MTAALSIVEPLPAHLTQHGSDPSLLGKELLAEIARSITEHPRSQQIKIGPSEIGHPCARRIGYKLLGHEEHKGEPAWKATVGTYVHSGLEEVIETANARLVAAGDEPRYLTEQTVAAGVIGAQVLDGHCDLYDRVTNTVVDWKTTGPTQLKGYKSKGPGNQYRVQAHTYGRGWRLRGFDVQRVAVMFLPRNGELREAYWWTEDYDEQIALDAMSRAEGIAITVGALGHAGISKLGTADAYCHLCPYFRANSTDIAAGCPGDESSRAATPSTPALTLGGPA